MDCNQIPAPELWDEASADHLHAYRFHVQICTACRQRLLKVAPEKLLFTLNQDHMPDEFWIGFWDSVSRKKTVQKTSFSKAALTAAALRWIAVLVIALIIALYGRSIHEPQQARNRVTDYPVIENIRNPQARYYIFQTSGQQVVMVFDPEADL
jgi:hypothetical protein